MEYNIESDVYRTQLAPNKIIRNHFKNLLDELSRRLRYTG